MLDKNFKEVLKIICDRLEKEKIGWTLVGSTNMVLQGISIEPRDLDIIIDFDDLKRMGDVFSDYEVSEIRELEPLVDKPAWEVTVKVEDVDVQVVGNKLDGEYAEVRSKDNIRFFEVEGFRVPCASLEIEVEIYERTKRDKRANQIRDFIKSKNL